MTSTRSASSATTPRSCVISTTDEPVSRRSVRIRSRIWAWIVTSSAVVGSSAISTSRVARERHRDHHPLAHAARELVRVVVDALLGRRGSRPSASSSIARSRAAAADEVARARGSAPRSASRPCRPGSATSSGPGRSSRSRCRGPRASCAAGAASGRARRRAPRPRSACCGSGTSRITLIIVTLLPEPDSPTMPSTSSAPSASDTPSTARDVAAVGEERHAQVAHVEQRFAHAVTGSRMRGSSRA